jgi:hypothetical protein
MPALATDSLLNDLLSRLSRGRDNAVAGSSLAADLAISQQTLRALVVELRRRGHLVGSLISGGYFICIDRTDVKVGLGHLRGRAYSMLTTYRAVTRAAEEQFGADVLRLFDLEEVASV